MSMNNLLCFLFLSLVDSFIIPHGVNNTIILVGESIRFECKVPDFQEVIIWKFIDLDEKDNLIYGFDTNDPNYQFDCPVERKSCSIEIISVTREMAGFYSCQSKQEGEVFMERMGFTLNVGIPTCKLNVGRDHPVIAVSDCKEVRATNLIKTCEFNYAGFYDDLKLRWVTKWNNGSIANTPQEHTSKNRTGSTKNKIFIFESQGPVIPEMANQTFECVVPSHGTEGLRCTTKLAAVKYARNHTGPVLQISKDNPKSKICEADASDSQQCSYSWSTPDPKHPTIYTKELRLDDMKVVGVYQCIADCTVGSHRCSVLADKFEVVSTSSGHFMIVIIVVAVIILLVAVAVIGFLVWRKKKNVAKKPAPDGKEMIGVVTVNEPLISANPNKTDQNIPAATPIPAQDLKPSLSNQSRNGGGGASSGGRKQSFKRGTSTKSSQEFHPIEEEADKNQVTIIGQKILLNDAKGQVMGIAHLGNRIFCIAKNSVKLFTFVDTPPYNRVMPEEVAFEELVNPQALVACKESKSLYVSDYTSKNVVYRIYPTIQEGNKVSKGKLDGQPASLDVDTSRSDTIVVALRRDKKMYIEIYDTSKAKNDRGSVTESDTWEKKYIIKTDKEVILPLFLATSKDDPALKRLYLLFGSAKFLSGGEFESYKVSEIDLETSRVYTTYDLKEISSNGSEKTVPMSMVSDESRGGILILDKRGQLVHLNSDLTLFDVEAKFNSHQNRFCLRPEERIVMLGGSTKSLPSIVCYKLKDVPAQC